MMYRTSLFEKKMVNLWIWKFYFNEHNFVSFRIFFFFICLLVCINFYDYDILVRENSNHQKMKYWTQIQS